MTMGMQAQLNQRTYELKDVSIKHKNHKVNKKIKVIGEVLFIVRKRRNVFSGIELSNLFVDEGFLTCKHTKRQTHTLL